MLEFMLSFVSCISFVLLLQRVCQIICMFKMVLFSLEKVSYVAKCIKGGGGGGKYVNSHFPVLNPPHEA